MIGNSEQSTRSGKNLLDIDKGLNDNFIKNNDGTYTILKNENGRFSNNIPIKLDVNTNYIVSFELIDTNSTYNNSLQFVVYYADGTNSTRGIARGDNKTTINLSQEVSHIRIYEDNAGSVGTYTTFKNLMISKEGGTYEKYGASPTPPFPSKIKNCGDNINIFNKDNANILNASINSQSALIQSSNISKSLYIDCKSNTTYTISRKQGQRFVVGTTDILPNTNVTCTKHIANQNASSITITTDNTSKYIVVFYYNSDADTLTEQEILDSIKIEQGSKATKWSRFGHGCVNLKVQNKNLAQKEKINSVGTKIAELNGYVGDITIAVKTDKGTAQVNYRIKYKDGSQSNKAIITVNQTNNVWYIANEDIQKEVTAIELYYTTNGTARTVANAMVMKGKYTNITDDDYVKHEEQTITFPLSEGQLLHEGDYLADDRIHHKRKTVVLDGTENWSSWENITGVFYLSIQNIAHNSEVLCSHYLYTNHTLNELNVNEITTIPGTGYYIWLKTEQNTLSEFKTYLAEQYANGTPVEIEYELENEEIEEYTEEQQKEYEKLKELHSYYGTTHITCEDEISCNFDIEYVQDSKLVRQNDKQELQIQIDEIKTLLSTSATSAMLLDNLENDLVEEV